MTKTPNGRGWRAKPKVGRVNLPSQTFKRQKDAQDWHDAQIRGVKLGEYIDPRAGRETVAAAWERWQARRQNSKAETTHATDRAAFLRFPASIRNGPVSTATASAFDLLYEDLLGSLARSSVVRYRTSYGAFFSWARQEGMVRSNPALAVEVGKGGVVQEEGGTLYPFSSLEVRAVHAVMVEAVGPALADVALVLGLTGLRWGELAALRVRDVQRVPRLAFHVARSKSDGVSLRNTTKGGKPRTVPLVEEVAAIVEPLLGGDPYSLLFGTRGGGYRSLASWKRDARWEAHAQGRTVKDLRHSFATNALTAGADVRVVQKWMGHASATLTIDLYGRWIRDDAEDRALDRLATESGGAGGAREEA
ncbi:tyrosine recombinase XerC [soil metagenome]